MCAFLHVIFLFVRMFQSTFLRTSCKFGNGEFECSTEILQIFAYNRKVSNSSTIPTLNVDQETIVAVKNIVDILFITINFDVLNGLIYYNCNTYAFFQTSGFNVFHSLFLLFYVK